ncbi:hypothetical protein G7Z17_g9636 [Cylindrodendrum hubeiense]|uniref:Peptidase A1 domain-containing protein n=1 Tax=Cylindrodendrum hubeiense TaxID=595255 RepID=A0A9P5H6E1_9HYPO|nr:hypothetical protein G7Z17_g9636 [Cylindrodendrum hubeiense]
MFSTLLSLAVVPALAHALDISHESRTAGDTGIIRFPVRTFERSPIKRSEKRQNEVTLLNGLAGSFHAVDINIGTPSQTIRVSLDTGSWELWVNAECSTSNDEAVCETYPRFTESESSSWVDLGTYGGLSYGSGWANVNYGQDTIGVGSALITGATFGVANESSFWPSGIMGAGPRLEGWNSDTPLLIDSMAQQGLINSRAFSLDIRSVDSEEGSIIYGGIDTGKYSGNLELRPIIPASEAPDGYTRFWVYLDGITITHDDGGENVVFSEVNGQAVFLDSGGSFTGLPQAMVDSIVSYFPTATLMDDGSSYQVDCDVADLSGTVDFTFGSTVINVPYHEFMRDSGDNCILDAPVLGETFLRAAYVVYDWDNKNIFIANGDNCGTNLVAIGSGSDAVPSLIGDCGVVATTSAEISTSAETTTAVSETPAVTTEEESGETTSTTPYSETTTSIYETLTAITEDYDETTTTTPDSETPTSIYETPAATTEEYNETTSTTLGSETTTSIYETPAATADEDCDETPSTTSSPETATDTPVVITTTPETLTSTIMTTKVYTITACPDTVTNCPVGSVTTEIITSYTTYCPATETESTGVPETETVGTPQVSASDESSTTGAPPIETAGTALYVSTSDESSTTGVPYETLTSTITTSKVYTVTTCPPTVSDCQVGSITTEIVTLYTTYCPATETEEVASSSYQTFTTGSPSHEAATTSVPSYETLTSTITSTNVYTITACPPTISNCPIGSITAEVLTSYTTYFPGATEPPAPTGTTTLTKTTTRVSTITDCLGKGLCTKGDVITDTYTSTQVVTQTRVITQETPTTYTVQKTVACKKEAGCVKGSSATTYVVTVQSTSENPQATSVPGCSGCGTSFNETSVVGFYTSTAKVPFVPETTPCATCGTEPSGTPVAVVGGATWNAPGLITVAMGVIFAAAI